MGQENLVILPPFGILRRGGLVYQCRCLSCPVESIPVNVGGSHMEGSSPPMKYASVGGPIVVGGRESRPHGEGGQGSDVWRSRLVRDHLVKSRWSWVTPVALTKRNPITEIIRKSPLPGEPDALKGARPVRRGAWGNVLKSNAPCAYLTGRVMFKPPPTGFRRVHHHERGRPMRGGVQSPGETHGRRRPHSTQSAGKPRTGGRGPGD
jgi:hypothetical protein